MVGRRSVLRTLGGVVTGASVAGCMGNDDGSGSTTTPTASPTELPVTDVAAGPEGRLRFDPDEIRIDVGAVVRWTFESTGHNVTSKPGASDKCENPGDAVPFASYDGANHFETEEVGTVYEHEFGVPGEYVYVCAPHEGQGMVGSITVTE